MAIVDESVTQISCELNVGIDPVCEVDVASRLITVTQVAETNSIVEGTEIELTLNEMLNPATAEGSSTFSVTVFEVADGNDYPIDSADSDLILSVNCDYPCRECPDGTSICETCLSDSSGIPLAKQETTCLEECDENYVEINFECLPCYE